MPPVQILVVGASCLSALWGCGEPIPDLNNGTNSSNSHDSDDLVSSLETRSEPPESGDDDDDDGSETSSSATDDDSSSTPTSSGSNPSSDSNSTTTQTSTDSTTSNTTSQTSGSTSSETTSTEEETTSDCPSLQVAFTQVIPTVLLVVDQSGSMAMDLSADVSRWQAMRNALVDGADALIPKFEADIRFGLALYTGDNWTCPTFDSVPSSLNNADAIVAKLDTKEPKAGTPTGESFEMALDLMQDDIAEGPQIFILVTDGEPATCADLLEYDGQDESLAAVTAAYDSGYSTYVIGVSGDVGAEHLQQLANVGQGTPALAEDADDEDVYQATNPQALADAFTTIINGVRPCTFTLEDAIKAGFEDDGTVTLGGTELVYNDPNGWRVNSPTEVEILGNACKELQQGTVAVQIEFSCEAITPG